MRYHLHGTEVHKTSKHDKSLNKINTLLEIPIVIKHKCVANGKFCESIHSGTLFKGTKYKFTCGKTSGVH